MRSFITILVAGIVLFSSCKKKDSVAYLPVNQPDTSVIPPLFTDMKMQILSDFEMNKNAPLNGHLLAKTLGGFDPFPFVFGYFDIVSKSMDGDLDKQFQEAIEEINNNLNGLHAEDSILLTDVAALSNLMHYNTEEIINQINNTSANSYITEVITAMGNGDQLGLRWFSQAAVNFKNHIPGYDSSYLVNEVAPAAQNFYSNYSASASPEQAFFGLSNLIGDPSIPGDSSSLVTFSKLLIGQFASNGQTNVNPILDTYLFLEYYYLVLFNYQMQAATVWMNVLKANKADTNEANIWWQSSAVPAILNGSKMFITATEYLVSNLAEYRNQARWTSDMKYSGLWMSPNTDIFNTLARAQFQVKRLTMGLNPNAPVIYGAIMVPQNYCSSAPKIQVAASSYTLPLTSNTCQGRIPYAKWNGNTCVPDNHWTFYNYGIGNNLACQPWNINIIPTWPHSNNGNGYGTITPLWYNPRNPQQTSYFKTDSCSLQFAFFSLSWQWGVMFSDYVNTSNGSAINNNLYINGMSGYGSNYCSLCGETEGLPTTAPFIAQWHSSQHKFEHIQNDMTRTFGNNAFSQKSPFKYHLNATVQPYSGGQMFVADQIASPVITLPDSLPNGTVELWSNYSWNFQLAWQNVSWGNFSIGSALTDGTAYCQNQGCNNSQPHVFCSKGDIISWGSASSDGLPPATNNFFWFLLNRGSHQPNFQYNFRIENLNNPTQLDAWVNLDMQVVFRGFFGY